MRRLAVGLLLCLLLAGCSKMVTIEVLPVTATPVDAPVQSLVLAADGSVLATLRFAHREIVDLDEVSPILLDAVLAAEDRRFYDHDGVDPRAVARAAVANQRASKVVQGGSTITQQLVKNRYFPDAEDTLERKVAEARLALELEARASKDAILADYLNTVYFGAGAHGIQAAARTYFGVDAADLDAGQAALLAGLIRAPERASPYTAPQRAVAERARVLDALVATGAMTRRRADELAVADLGLQPRAPAPATRVPHYVEHVKRTLLRDPTFGPDERTRVHRLFGGGLRIHTALDPAIQTAAETAAWAVLDAASDPEVAVAVVRPDTGHVVATVGGRDFASSQFDLETQGRRQPGSTFKTFALVAALQDGMRLDDRIDSGSANLALGQGATWTVRSATRGQLDLRTATAVSSNGAYARLALRLGGDRIAEQARLMGVVSDVGTNPAIVLGGLRDGVTPLEMASSYATLAGGGISRPPIVVTMVTDADGVVVWEPDSPPVVAMEPATAWFATDALRTAVEEGTGRAARLDRPAAGKTGTVQDNRDAWFVGFTPQLSAAVWIGYPEAARPLHHVEGVARVHGGTWPARIWRDLMTAALAGEPALDFTYPSQHTITVEVDPTSGGLATQWCPLREEVTGLPGELPIHYCPLHREPEPTAEPTAEPTTEPTAEPTAEPTSAPTLEPTAEPAAAAARPDEDS